MHNITARKIFLGLQSFARTWKLTDESQISGVPPITSDGPGKEGPLTNQQGYLSYSEVKSHRYIIMLLLKREFIKKIINKRFLIYKI